MKRIFLVVLMTAVFAGPCFGENYLLNGGQESEISYEMVQVVEPKKATKKIVLSWVKPRSYSSPTYKQEIKNLDISFSPRPESRSEAEDDRGNTVITAEWKAPLKTITTRVSLLAANTVRLETIRTNAPFPLKEIPQSVKAYLQGTEQVDVEDKAIRAKAAELTASAKTQFDAVQKIMAWIVDNMRYVLTPKSYNAVYSMKTGKGNCQNYSHLAAALMRSSGIPVRIINGITLKKPYDIDMGARGSLTMKMAQGRHSWIEVWFPDLGWTPFDPQNSQMFVSNRFIRVEAGLDNNETSNDGLIRWTQTRGQDGSPDFREDISGSFVLDSVKLAAKKTAYGPNALVVGPPVKADFAKIKAKPKPPPAPVEVKDIKSLDYTEPYVMGNLDFPENVDFAFASGPAKKGDGDTMEIRKGFMVETAEYVTTRGRQYAQTFILKKPISLSQVGLALHSFGGDGQLWVELYEDDKGAPGEYAGASDFLSVDSLKYSPGYYWVDFDFRNSNLILAPGRYWIAMSFTGGPIVNWFFTYGKPVGPQDGTRYKKMFDPAWSRSLSYEFNYRIKGLVPAGN